MKQKKQRKLIGFLLSIGGIAAIFSADYLYDPFDRHNNELFQLQTEHVVETEVPSLSLHTLFQYNEESLAPKLDEEYGYTKYVKAATDNNIVIEVMDEKSASGETANSFEVAFTEKEDGIHMVLNDPKPDRDYTPYGLVHTRLFLPATSKIQIGYQWTQEVTIKNKEYELTSTIANLSDDGVTIKTTTLNSGPEQYQEIYTLHIGEGISNFIHSEQLLEEL